MNIVRAFLFVFFINSLYASDIPIAKPDITSPQLQEQSVPIIELPITLKFAQSHLQVAAFERNGWYWFAFNQACLNNIHDILESNHLLYKQYEIIQDDQYLVFRIKTITLHDFPNIQQQGNTLEITFTNSLPIKAPKLTYKINNFNISLPAFNGIKEYIQVIDPDIKDKILIVLADINQTIVEKDNQFTYCKLLDSNYGIAINDVSNRLMPFIKQGILYIYHPDNHLKYLPSQFNLSTPIFQFSEWYNDGKYFEKTLTTLRQEISNNNSLDSRLNLVRFFLGHKMTTEALSYLNYIYDLDPNYYNYKLLHIASLYLSQNYYQAHLEIEKIAIEYLNYQQLQELNFWQSATLIQLHYTDVKITYNNSFIQQYQYYDIDFALLILKQAITTNDTSIISEIQEVLQNKKLSKHQHNTFMLLIADATIADQEKSLSIYDEISQDNQDIYNQASAILKKVKYLYYNNLIDIKSSINELEKIHPLIKGEDIEAVLLDTLAELYINNQQYYEGLLLLKTIHTNFSYYHNILKVNQSIYKNLVYLFNEGGIHNMLPITVVDIFINFKDLLPIGRIGAEIALNFADYLIKIDLVNEAEDFLQHLIKYRLYGDEKKQNIIKLANLYLNNHQPEQVISLFNQYIIQDKRTLYLQSKAFLQLGEAERALTLLDQDNSDAANKIKLDILWNIKAWDRIIALIEPKLHYRQNPEQELSDIEQKYIFCLAVSYFQKGDKSNLDKLYDAFSHLKLHNHELLELFNQILTNKNINMATLNKLYKINFN